MSPVQLRFFAEEGADHCVWADEEDPGQLERSLPMPEVLRARMRAWIVEFNQRAQERTPGPWTEEEHQDFDRRGYELSRELQQNLGPEYEVTYRFRSSAVRKWAQDNELSGTTRSSPAPQLRRLVELLRAIAVLALPAAPQRDWLATRGVPVSGDGLVIDVYEIAPHVEQFRNAGWIGRRATEQIGELNRVLNQMSGSGSSHLWTSDALDSAPEWEKVRLLSRSVLAEM